MSNRHETLAMPRLGKRRNSRLRLDLEGRLTTHAGTQRVILNDLSVTGAMLSFGDPVRLNSDALLTWAGFEAFGTIVWKVGSQCGLCFDEPLPEKVVTTTRTINDHQPDRRAVQRRLAHEFVTGASDAGYGE